MQDTTAEFIENTASAAKGADGKEKVGMVPGFSQRFQELLDRASFPPMGDGRINLGAEVFGVSKSGFRGWCQFDTPPRVFSELRRVVEILLDRADRNDVLPEAVMGWLYVGELRGNPFSRSIGNDALAQEIYVSVRIVANKKGIDFNSLATHTQEMLLVGASKFAEKLIEKGAGLKQISNNLELEHFIDSLMDAASAR